MEYIVMILSLVLGLIGIYIGLWTFRKYTSSFSSARLNSADH